jgi:hypothetical protein
MLVGYMRVSSESDRQTTDLQRDALLAAGIDERTRLGFAILLAFFRDRGRFPPGFGAPSQVIHLIVLNG